MLQENAQSLNHKTLEAVKTALALGLILLSLALCSCSAPAQAAQEPAETVQASAASPEPEPSPTETQSDTGAKMELIRQASAEELISKAAEYDGALGEAVNIRLVDIMLEDENNRVFELIAGSLMTDFEKDGMARGLGYEIHYRFRSNVEADENFPKIAGLVETEEAERLMAIAAEACTKAYAWGRVVVHPAEG